MKCDICGNSVEKNKRGRPRLRHDACSKTHEALAYLERVLDPSEVDSVGYTREALVELRYRILILSTEVPRVRDASGRFYRRTG